MNHLKKIAVIGYGGFAREIACNLKKGTYNFFVNKQYINSDNISIYSSFILSITLITLLQFKSEVNTLSPICISSIFLISLVRSQAE